MFDKNFQDKVLGCLLQVPEFCMVAAQHMRPEELDGPLAMNMGSMAIDFWHRYEAVMTDVAFVELTRQLVTKGSISKSEISIYVKEYRRLRDVDVSDWRFILDRLIAFVKNQKIKAMIDRAVKKHLPKEDFESIEKTMDEIKSISTLHEVSAYDYWDETMIEEREKTRKEEMLMRQVGISTGIRRLDEQFHKRGFWKKELYVFLAPPKRGKSMALIFFANAASLQGKTVAFFTCENSKEITSTRLDAMNSDVPSKLLNERAGKVATAVQAGIPAGKIYIFEYPTKTLTVSEIDRQLRRLQIEKGVLVDMVVADYLDILKPSRYSNDKYEDQGSLGEELRGLAGKRKLPVVTASQVNRSGANKTVIGGGDVAGSYDKIMIADEIITISATDEEIANSVARLHFANSRNSGNATFTIETAFDRGRFYKNFIEDEI